MFSKVKPVTRFSSICSAFQIRMIPPCTLFSSPVPSESESSCSPGGMPDLSRELFFLSWVSFQLPKGSEIGEVGNEVEGTYRLVPLLSATHLRVCSTYCTSFLRLVFLRKGWMWWQAVGDKNLLMMSKLLKRMVVFWGKNDHIRISKPDRFLLKHCPVKVHALYHVITMWIGQFVSFAYFRK